MLELPGRLSVRENLRVYASLCGVHRPVERIGELTSGLDLIQLLDRKTKTLSVGQKSRANLAKALINRPKVLPFDEPTASLNPDTADWISAYLQAYQRETGVFILLTSP